MKFVIPLTSFVHGSVNGQEGQALELEDSMANDLERAGLVRTRFEPPANKASGGKATGDGAGQPSSASPAAPALPLKTSPKSTRGAAKPTAKKKSGK